MTEETTPQRARRMGREYANARHGEWSSAGRQWIKYAFANGYHAACLDQATEAEKIGEALDRWEKDGDDVLLVQTLDDWLERIYARAPEESGEAA